jgi:hypothetical protein
MILPLNCKARDCSTILASGCVVCTLYLARDRQHINALSVNEPKLSMRLAKHTRAQANWSGSLISLGRYWLSA